MCVSIRAPAQDLIISSVYQRAKTLSRSTAARFEVNLHNGPMFALSWARALSVSVGTVMSWEHRGRDAHSRWLILESDAQLAPMDVRMGDSQQYEWVERCCSDGNYSCMDTKRRRTWMLNVPPAGAACWRGQVWASSCCVWWQRSVSARSRSWESVSIGKPLLITAECFYLWIYISRCICCLFCLIQWLQSYLNS